MESTTVERSSLQDRIEWAEEMFNDILIAAWNEAHIEYWEREAEAKAQADARKPDKEKLLAFAEIVGALEIPEMKTDEGEIVSTVVDSMLRDIVTFIADETGKF